MLDKAFQVVNIDLLYYFQFFIRDIRQQLEENQCSSVVRTYRAQLMPNAQVQLIKDSLGELISINTFLSTIPNRQRTLAIFKQSVVSDEMKQVLFEIHADPHLNDIKPFSDISSLNYFTSVEVVCFMAGTIFRPTNIHEENNIQIIQMDVCSDTNDKIKNVLEKMKSESYTNGTNLLSFGHILSKMKRYDEAEKYYHRFLDDMPNDHHCIARCYQRLGDAVMEKHDYDTCLEWYQKALDTNRLVLRSEDPEIASGYSMIANVHVKKGALNDALEFYTQALQIWTRALGKSHSNVATCYKNMACVFEMQERYSEALEYFKKALTIREKHVSSDQLDVAELHNHIADVYASTADMSEALKHYNFALKMFKKTYTSKHPDVLSIIRNIGLAHEKLGNLTEALAHFEKVASKRRQVLPPDHSDLMKITQDIQRVSSQLNKTIQP